MVPNTPDGSEPGSRQANFQGGGSSSSRASPNGKTSRAERSNATTRSVAFNLPRDDKNDSQVESVQAGKTPSEPSSYGANSGADSRSTKSIRTKDDYEGLLAFLNNPACWQDGDGTQSDLLFPRKPSEMLEGCGRRCRNLSWRFQAAFRKKGTLRRIPPDHFLARKRNRVGEVVMSPAVQAFVLTITLVDIITTLYQLVDEAAQNESDVSELLFFFIDVFVVAVLATEVLCRVFYLGRRFTHSILNLLEFALIPTASTELVMRGSSYGTEGPVQWQMLRTLRPILRGVNLGLKAARGYSRVKQFRNHLQQQVNSSNRRLKQGTFDLDLCYVTPQIIAMGRPAIGKDALYNNPHSEVVRYLSRRHPNRYIVINVSDSSEYPVEDFLHRVVLFPVHEMGVPKLIDLWNLCVMMNDFLESDSRNVCALHTKVGNGRVGMIAAAWLLFNGTFRQADEAVCHFERKRTEPRSKSTVPGVDCASQHRFMEYFNLCVKEIRAVPDAPRTARLKTIKVLGIDPEVAPSLSVRCFQHTQRTNVRTAAAISLMPAFCSDHSVQQLTSGTLVASEEEQEAQLLLMSEDEVLQQAMDEQGLLEFDTFAGGCGRQKGTAILDTVDDNRVLSFTGETGTESDVAVWQIDKLELEGEICFEVHRTISDHEVNPQGDESTQLLLAFWLHTSFLELSQGAQNRRLREGRNFLNQEEQHSIVVTLDRFAIDKGAKAPTLRSYACSFEIQLVFEVDELMQYGRTGDDPNKRMRIGSDSPDGTKTHEGLRLQPPTQSDISREFSAHWLTWCVHKIWPFIDKALNEVVKNNVEPMVAEMVPAGFGKAHISKFSLGKSTPVFDYIVACERSGIRAGIQLDIGIRYEGDANLLVTAGHSKVGVTQFSLESTLSLLFDPIVNALPIVGGMHMFFLNPPALKMEFQGLAEVANFSILQKIIQKAINRALSESLVLPNVMTLNWMPDNLVCGDPSCCLSSTLPTGVLRATVLELKLADRGCWHVPSLDCYGGGGEGPSNTGMYVVLQLGALEGSVDVKSKAYEFMPNVQSVCEPVDLVEYDVKQHFAIELWERNLMGKRMISRSQPQELYVYLHGHTQDDFRRSVEVPLESINVNDGDDRVGNGVVLRLDLFELHGDRQRLTEACCPLTASEKCPVDPHRTGITFSTSMLPPLALSRRPQPCNNGAALATALLVFSVMKGRLCKQTANGQTPSLNPAEVPSEYSLHVQLDDVTSNRHFTARDTAWKDFVDISDALSNTVQALNEEGFTVERIAAMLSMDQALVEKIVAYRRGFNVEIPQHFCLLVKPQVLIEGSLRLEVRHNKRVEAFGEVAVQELWSPSDSKSKGGSCLTPKATGKNREVGRTLGPARRLVSLSPAGSSSSQSVVDLDIEFRLLAFVEHKLDQWSYGSDGPIELVSEPGSRNLTPRSEESTPLRRVSWK